MNYGVIEQQQQRTHFEACRQLLIDLSIKMRAVDKDIDVLVWLYKEIRAYPLDVQIQAFDAVVDYQGWC